ncbi:MAG TPA: hypothetical protein PKK96_04185 [Anaerolineales bacterium]|nr:hypothetical protein [Anaerolineales bacterium]HNQ96110.1 hypothetical protein [Anaerolineales bacterium]HNS60181.1 hypothetical protein [Anaerolineales bacterium]
MSPKKVAAKTNVWSDEEKAAMKERAKELRAEERAGKDRAAGEKAVLAAHAAMKESERAMAKKIHEIVKVSAPALIPKTWYGMPAYANADGKVVCFFQAGSKYGSRYCTFGLTDSANLDDGNMWAAGFALIKLSDAEEKKIVALVKKAMS